MFGNYRIIKYNNRKFKYAECYTCTNKNNLSLYNDTNGFFTEYSKSNTSEDMTEVFSLLMTLSQKKLNEVITNYHLLHQKVNYINRKIVKIERLKKWNGGKEKI